MKPRSEGRVLLAGLAFCLAALFVFAPAAGAASGDLAWQRAYNGTGNGQDSFGAVAVAPNGGAYVAGVTATSTFDFVAARYDAGGQRRWLRTYNGPGDGLDWFGAATSDRRGDLIEAGYVTTPAKTLVTAVVKYDAAGHLRWVRIHNVATDIPDNPLAVAVDARGNVYVASTEGVDYDVVVLKYSASGAHRWTSRYAGPNADIPTDIALDGAGNVYVTGYSYQGTTRGYDALTLKLSAGGHRRWARLWDGPSISDVGLSLAVTKAGTVYVGGFTNGAKSGQDALLLKYTTGGALRWSRTYTGAGADSDAYNDIVLLGNGDIAAAGSSYDGADLFDVLLARYEPSGSPRWTRLYDGPDSLNDQGLGVARGRAGAIYVAGDTTSNSTGQDALLLKYNGAGVLRWARSYSSSGNANDYVSALAVVPGKSVYVAGDQAAGTSSDGMLLRYRP